MQKYDTNTIRNCGIPQQLFSDSVARETAIFKKGLVLVAFVHTQTISHLYIPQHTSATDSVTWASEALRKGVVPILASWSVLSSEQLQGLFSLSEESGSICVFALRNPQGLLSLNSLNPQGKPSYLNISAYFTGNQPDGYRNLALEYLVSAQLMLGAAFRKVKHNLLKAADGSVFMHEFMAVSNRGDRLVLTVAGGKNFNAKLRLETPDLLAESDSGNYFILTDRTEGKSISRHHIVPMNQEPVLLAASDNLLYLNTAKLIESVIVVATNP